eukprot:14154521-Ditylum_brightwellii.AAC.1
MLKRRSSATVANGGFMHSVVLVHRLYALIWWVHNIVRQGDTVDPNQWLDVSCASTMIALNVQEQAKDKETDVKASTAFDPKDWWNEEHWFENFIGLCISCDGITPLSYVIRGTIPMTWTTTTWREKLIYNAALAGPIYSADNTAIFGALKQWVISTNGYDWIKQFDSTNNGRRAMVASRDHYSGPGKVAKRMTQAKKTLKDLFYKNKVGITFEKKRGATQDRRGEGRIHVSKITSQDQDIRAAIRIVAMIPRINANLSAAANSLSKQ